MSFINIHIIQSVPASCLNRDDTGSPKTLVFGNGGGNNLRARLSSQSQKRAVKVAVREATGGRTRLTKEVPALLVKALGQARDDLSPNAGIADQMLWDLAAAVLTKNAGLAMTIGESLSLVASDGSSLKGFALGALYYVNIDELERLAVALIASNATPAGLDKRFITANSAVKDAIDAVAHSCDPEIALYGRMSAVDHSQNVDACVQVAHAVGVSPYTPQFDFFTAKDDVKQVDLGAGMMGHVEFDAPVLYRYAAISVDELVKTTGDVEVSREAISNFVRAFITTLPGGRQNSFAALTVPEFVLVTVADAPVNLAQAFMIPSTGDIVPEAVGRLAGRLAEVARAYYPSTAEFTIASDDLSGSFLAQRVTLTEIGDAVTAVVLP